MSAIQRKMKLTSAETAARYLALRRKGANRERRPNITDDAILREVLLGILTSVPQTPKSIFEAICVKYGPCSQRRLWREFQWLYDRKMVRRVAGGYVYAKG